MDIRIDCDREFLARINDAMPFSLAFDYGFVYPGSTGDANFSRHSASDAIRDASYSAVAHEFGGVGVAVPRTFGGAHPMIQPCAGVGYKNSDENPNATSVGTSCAPLPEPVLLGVPVADAQATALVHTKTGALVNMSGIWQQVAAGSAEASIEALRCEVLGLGGNFNIRDVWAVMSPGARGETFFVDKQGIEMFEVAGSHFFRGERIVELETPVREGGRVKTHRLDLGGLIWDQWIRLKIPDDQIFFDPRNNMTYTENGRLVLPSKRLSDRKGKKYKSALFVAVTRRV